VNNDHNAFSSVTNADALPSQATTQDLVRQRREYFEHLFPDTGHGMFINIHWINTYQAMIVPSLSFALPLAVWNLTAFFRQMPQELEQAAMVDGCTPAQAFRKVILPLAAPGVFTTAIITFIAAWNEFLIALSMTNKKSIQTANVIISQFTGTTGRDQPFGSQMAAGVVVTIPLVIAVLLFQRRIVAGLTAGGVK